MLLPALNQARAKAHQASCTGALKQLGLANCTYLNDNRGMSIPILGKDWIYWADQQSVRSYLGIGTVDTSQSNRQAESRNFPAGLICSSAIRAQTPDDTGKRNVMNAYGINAPRDDSWYRTYDGFNSARLKTPSRLMAFCDATDNRAFRWSSNTSQNHGFSTATPPDAAARPDAILCGSTSPIWMVTRAPFPTVRSFTRKRRNSGSTTTPT